MKENWKWVPGFEAVYEVSDQGRVRSWQHGSEPKIIEGNFKNRVIVTLYKDGVPEIFMLGRLVLLAFDKGAGKFVQYKNDDVRDNRFVNLEWSDKRKIISFVNHGSKNGSAKLDEDSVRSIKVLLKRGDMTQTAIANMFNISKPIISWIKSGKRWAHVKV